MFKRLAEVIWAQYESKIYKKKRSFNYQKTARMLVSLNPGREINGIVAQYYKAKIEKVLILIFAGILLITFSVIGVYSNRRIDEDNRLLRNGYGEEGYETEVIAQYDENQYELTIRVDEQEYTGTKMQELWADCVAATEIALRGNNPSLMHVSTDLSPMNEVPGFPFYITWETSDYELFHSDGVRGERKPDDNGEECYMTAHFTYKDYSFDYKYEIRVFPKDLTKEERDKERIIASILDKGKETQFDSYLQLPTSIGNESISWKEPQSPMPVMLATLLLVSLFGVWMGTDNDLAKKYRKRNQFLTLEYSEFVSKLQLLIGSGMTLRSAFERMGDDYRASLENGGEKKYVYEELMLCIKKMRDGVSEEDSYIYFSNRCNLINYKKLMTLLIQNNKKGTLGLIQSLSNETKQAFEERKQIARRMGEEAQTKLLFPMIIMLLVVMIIIIVPAYVSFGI